MARLSKLNDRSSDRTTELSATDKQSRYKSATPHNNMKNDTSELDDSFFEKYAVCGPPLKKLLD